MPDVLHLKAEEIDTVEKRGKYHVCIVGCKQQGVLYAVAFAEAGFKVVCVDADQSLVRSLIKGRNGFLEQELGSKYKNAVTSGILSFTDDLKSVVAQSDIIVLSPMVKVDEKKTLDSSNVENSCKQIGAMMQQGALVLYVGVVGFGFMEGVVKEKLESSSGFKAGDNFGLAYVQAQNGEWEGAVDAVDNQELMIAANDRASLDAASLVLSAITKKKMKVTMSFRAAELATLFALARKDVSKALTNELAVLCEKAQVDYIEILKLLNVDLQGSDYVPGIDGQKNKIGIHLLLECAENLGAKLRLPELAEHVNDDMIKHAVNLTQATLRSCGKTLRRARIAVLGVTSAGTSSEAFVRMLEMKGVRIKLYDSRGVRNERSDSTYVSKRSVVEAVENSDCIVVVTAEDQFKNLNLKNLRSVMRTPAAIVDLAGVFDSRRVESEGFIYRGLGRGFERE